MSYRDEHRARLLRANPEIRCTPDGDHVVEIDGVKVQDPSLDKIVHAIVKAIHDGKCVRRIDNP